MNGLTLTIAFAGIACFGIGAVLSASEQINLGVVFMGLGLVLQVASLLRIKQEKKRAERMARNRGHDNAGR